MRFQTSFENLTQVTNGRLFIFCFVGLRVLIGIYCLAFWHEVRPTPFDAPINHVFVNLAALCLFSVAGSFIAGLLVRPVVLLVALVWGLYVLDNLDSMVLHASPMELTYGLGLLMLAGLFMSGGAGHIFGIDGMISRNIRRPNVVTKFLFG